MSGELAVAGAGARLPGLDMPAGRTANTAPQTVSITRFWRRDS